MLSKQNIRYKLFFTIFIIFYPFLVTRIIILEIEILLKVLFNQKMFISFNISYYLLLSFILFLERVTYSLTDLSIFDTHLDSVCNWDKETSSERKEKIQICWIATDTSTIYLAIRTIAMKRRVQRPLTGFALVALLMVSLITRSRNNHGISGTNFFSWSNR